MRRISKRHAAMLDELFPLPAVRKEIVQRVLNSECFFCRHGKRMPFGSGCKKCQKDIHDIVSLRQSAELSDSCMVRWMKRAAELGDKQAQKLLKIRRKAQGGPQHG